MIWNLIPVQYRAACIATICIAALVAAFTAGWKIESWRWDAEKSKQTLVAFAMEQEAQKKSQDLQKVADDVQQGATTAVRSVYEYYEKHPRVKYVGVDGVQSSCGGQTMPNTTKASSIDNAGATNNGHASSGASEEVQVIQPNLLQRCALTTVQALECKKYVEDIYKVYTNQEK